MRNQFDSMTPQDFRKAVDAIHAEVSKIIVGQDDVIRHVLIGILSNGHVLLEGVPGLGKTMIIRTLSRALALEFSRIQFTPDLMEESEDNRRAFRFQRGPVFANLVLADEINRATPKTQSALLEAMQERTVTVANSTHPLPAPFFVLSTQNPIEQEGTYPLPEAQLDRFMFKVNVPFPSPQHLTEILNRTTGGVEPLVLTVAGAEQLIAMQALARQVPVPSSVGDFVSRLIVSTHPAQSPSDKVNRYVRYGASPRGGQALMFGAKVMALIDGRLNASFDDVIALAPAALRHRILLNFEGQATDTSPDEIVTELLHVTPRETVPTLA
jgi:MoxR-like ATPase